MQPPEPQVAQTPADCRSAKLSQICVWMNKVGAEGGTLTGQHVQHLVGRAGPRLPVHRGAIRGAWDPECVHVPTYPGVRHLYALGRTVVRGYACVNPCVHLYTYAYMYVRAHTRVHV